jgi:LysR family transcriptional regulator for metE and metH
MIDIRHLRTLLALREAGSLAEAAERLHLTQSALSHQLKGLEDDTGLQVFVRKSNPPRFTRAGERLLELADLVLPAMREAERDLARMKNGRAGRLTMAIECHSCFEWLMPALNRFRSDWPEVELDFVSGFQADAQTSLARRELDLVVTSNPGADRSLRFVPLFDYEALLVVGLSHPLAAKKFVEPQDLAGETLITYPVDEERLDIFAHFLWPAGVRPAKLRQSELTLMMVQLAASGRGVCGLPGWAAQEYVQRGWVKTLPLGKKGIWRTLYAAVRDEEADTPFVQDFLLTARRSSEATLAGIRPARS